MSSASASPSTSNPKVAALILDAIQILWIQGVDPTQLPKKHISSSNSNSLLQTPPLSPVESSAPSSPSASTSSSANDNIQLSTQQGLIHHVMRLLSPTTMNNETICLALILICRLRGMNRGDAVRVGAEPHLLSTAFLISLKALDDWRIDSVAWVAYCKLELNVINAMEREFLGKIHWHVNVTRDEYCEFMGFLAGLSGDTFGGMGTRVQYRPIVPQQQPSVLIPSPQIFNQHQYVQQKRRGSVAEMGGIPASVLSTKRISPTEQTNRSHMHSRQMQHQESHQDAVTSYHRYPIAPAHNQRHFHPTYSHLEPTSSRKTVHGRHVSNPLLTNSSTSWRVV
ncbi:hypothetical protein BDR26DRAFT_1004123 [Obelidium mucronatum]|nr:hypothetical protein BDR26DRAFT_1004123 [Obelidium mucronatum]